MLPIFLSNYRRATIFQSGGFVVTATKGEAASFADFDVQKRSVSTECWETSHLFTSLPSDTKGEFSTDVEISCVNMKAR